MDERRLELRVALLLLASLGSAGVLLWLVGALQLGGDQVLHVDLAHSGGVPAGAPVKLAGVKVGRVRAVHLLADRRDDRGRALPVQLDLTLDAAVVKALHQDARATVAMQGALGEPCVELSTGSAQAPQVKPGDTLRGIDPPRLDVLLARMDSLTASFADLLGRTDEAKAEAQYLLAKAGGLAQTTDQLLKDHGPELLRALTELQATAGDVRALVNQGRALLKGGQIQSVLKDSSALTAHLTEDVPPMLKDARKLTASATALAGDFTPADGAQLKATIARFEGASERLEKIAARADAIVGNIEAGKGTLGGFYVNPQVYDDLRQLITDIKAHPWKVLLKGD
jgi:phospholipid/cholesterol/gamma-HCH transport system substrate-binding protein